MLTDVEIDARKFFEEEFEFSGFNIVYPVWIKLNPRATNFEKDKFLHDFGKAFFNRPSNRISNKSKTVPDPLVLKLLANRIYGISEEEEKLIAIGHKLAMSAENIIGAILEEYIHNSLINFGWSACWGNCIKAVDFCSSEGNLLQVKNKSNTENSSSNKIRNNTDIIKWFRFNASNGNTRWDELNQLTTGENTMSEESFQAFAVNLIRENPSAINISSDDQIFLNHYFSNPL